MTVNQYFFSIFARFCEGLAALPDPCLEIIESGPERLVLRIDGDNVSVTPDDFVPATPPFPIAA